MPGALQLLLKGLVGDDWYYYERMIDVLIRDITWDYCGWWDYMWGVGCVIDAGGLRQVVNSYMSYVKKAKIAGWLYDLTSEQRSTLAAFGYYFPAFPDNARILSSVATSSGQTERVVRIVLNALYTATVEDRLQSGRFLRPYTWTVTAADRKQLDEYKAGGVVAVAGDVLEAAKTGLNVVAFLLPVAAVGAAGYYGYKVYQEAFG